MGGGNADGVKDVQTIRFLGLMGLPASQNGLESTGDRRGCGSDERFLPSTGASFHCDEQFRDRTYSQIP
jgi:hypothetical protein